MKLISTLLLMILYVQLSFAQTSQKHPGQPYSTNSFMRFLLEQNKNKAAFKTTAHVERLFAQSTREYILAPDSLTDSVYLQYNGLSSRHSTYDYNLLLYPYNYPYSNTPMINFFGYTSKPEVLFDTFFHWTVVPDTITAKLTYMFYEKTFCSYDAANNLTHYYDQFADSVGNQNMSYINNFDGSGNITSAVYFKVTLGVPDSFYKQYFSYNSSKQLIADSLYLNKSSGWAIEAKSYYTYDAFGNLTKADTYADTSLPLNEKLQYINTYDASNRLATVLISEFDGTSLAQYEKDTFSYANSSINFHTSWKQYRWDGVNHYWAPVNYFYKLLNTSNLPDTAYAKSFDSTSNSWIPQDMYTLTYDSANNPLKLNDRVYNGTTYPAIASFTTNYYYEQYPGVGVANTSVQNDHVLVYPNPATDKIMISQIDLPVNSRVQISILNLNGQALRTMNVSWQNNAIAFPVADMVAGNYYLLVNDAKGNPLHKQLVVKL